KFKFLRKKFLSVVSTAIERTQSAPPPSPSSRDKRETSQAISLPANLEERYFDPLEAAKQLLKSQEVNTKAIEPPPKEGRDRISKANKEEDLQVIMEAAPPGQYILNLVYMIRSQHLILFPAFTGGKALTTYQLSAIETLIGLKQCYMNVKREEEYKVLPRYLEAVISLFRLITTFLSWKETILRLDGWNP
ncbi:hypothetical protein VP01_6281g1, partial [Puccinia sorghi]